MDHSSFTIQQESAVIHESQPRAEFRLKILSALRNQGHIAAAEEDLLQTCKGAIRFIAETHRLYQMPPVNALAGNTVRRRRTGRQRAIFHVDVVRSFS